MARQRQEAAHVPTLAENLEITVTRVKRDLVWVLVSVVVAIGSGLVLGSLFKF